jgi:hypothetical protein
MEEEIPQEGAFQAAEKNVISLSLEDLKSVLTQALAPIQQQVESLKSEIDVMRVQGEMERDNVPQAGRKGDPNVRWSDQRIARKATIATRAATDNPGDYDHIVDSSSLTQRGG